MNLIASTTTFGFFTLISRILGYVRDILIAIFLGTGLLADVFFVAFRLPNTFRRLFAEGTFNAAFIPSYAGILAKNKIGSFILFCSICGLNVSKTPNSVNNVLRLLKSSL